MAVLIPMSKIIKMIIQSINIRLSPSHVIIRDLIGKSPKNIMPRTIPKKNLINIMITSEKRFSDFFIAYPQLFIKQLLVQFYRILRICKVKTFRKKVSSFFQEKQVTGLKNIKVML
jgi:hypothetical protein